jgi:phage terminase large subunit-like protein
VCTTWGVFKKRYYLLDVSRKRLNFPDLKREVRRLDERFSPKKSSLKTRRQAPN